MAPRDDDTVRVAPVPASARRARSVWPLVGVAIVLLGLGGGAAWWFLTPAAPTAPVAPVATLVPVRQAGEAEIRDNRATDLDVFRFGANPRILVLDFASLRRQGAMLNRVAAMAEKLGQPRDRALDDAELDRVIRAGGDTPETFYYGHDYDAAMLARFFAAVDRQKLALTPEEVWLRGLLHQEGFDKPGAVGALITLPSQDTASGIDAGTRATILHHELSHGEFFTNPAYAEWVQQFWRHGLSAEGRAAFTKFLVSENYDPTLEELMANETQAYLMFSPDPRFFRPDLVGMDAETMAALRQKFREGMPPGWLRDVAIGDAARARP